MSLPSSIGDLQQQLADHDYIADEGLATSIYLALKLNRPLLLEGEAGVGKTEVAKVLAATTGTKLIKELAQKSQAILVNFRPQVMDRLGLGDQELRKVKLL